MSRILHFRTRVERELLALGIKYPPGESDLPPPADAAEVLANELEALRYRYAEPPTPVNSDDEESP